MPSQGIRIKKSDWEVALEDLIKLFAKGKKMRKRQRKQLCLTGISKFSLVQDVQNEAMFDDIGRREDGKLQMVLCSKWKCNESHFVATLCLYRQALLHSSHSTSSLCGM